LSLIIRWCGTDKDGEQDKLEVLSSSKVAEAVSLAADADVEQSAEAAATASGEQDTQEQEEGRLFFKRATVIYAAVDDPEKQVSVQVNFINLLY